MLDENEGKICEQQKRKTKWSNRGWFHELASLVAQTLSFHGTYSSAHVISRANSGSYGSWRYAADNTLLGNSHRSIEADVF
jgi:hypothetical protein